MHNKKIKDFSKPFGIVDVRNKKFIKEFFETERKATNYLSSIRPNGCNYLVVRRKK